ncbi:heavy metal-associated isoprenylated plant protein 3-like [Canna indica]|uniref:Heavy metal-associated isoprenylated plant protein 3-like n=1 Tax=Canna indica TaxID=4628 RepID=A0AAQ3JRG8_9LILI|nr:heavy metal-associated isoprenylated plant protein 3-like [Canna indica]
MGKKKNKQREREPSAKDNEAAAEEGGAGGEEKEEKKDEGGGRKEEKDGGAGSRGKEEKKNDNNGSITVVLKVDMHCEGCTKKVIKSVKGVSGVEAVKADAASGKLTVVGKLDPWKLRDRVEAKNHKKVDLVSPTNLPKKAVAAGDSAAAKQAGDKKSQEKLVVTTATLKIRLHCEGCIRRIRKTILKIKGVENVVFDTQKDQVTVKGTMDVKPLPDVLKAKLKREVELVQPKKDGGADEKKEKGGGGGGGKKKGGEGGGGGEKKDNAKAAAASAEPPNALDYYAGYGYRIEMVHAPQLFSDENPNSCSVM